MASTWFESLDRRLLLAAQPYDWKSVAIKGNGFIDGIVYSSAAPNNVYMHTDMGGAYRWDQSASKWMPLTDWIQLNDAAQNNGAESMAADPTDANRVYLVSGTYQSTAAILRSSDGGRTWQRTDVSGIQVDGNGWGRALGERMAVDPNLPSIVYYGARYYDASHRGLWKSSDYAATWTEVASFTNYGDVRDKDGDGNTYESAESVGMPFVIFDKASGTPGSATPRAYVGVTTSVSSNQKLMRTADGGATWSAVPNQPTTTLFPMRAALSGNGSVMYVTYASQAGPLSSADTGGIVYKVTNPSSASPTWTNITPSGASGMFAAIAIDPTNSNTVYTSAQNNWPCNIWRSTNGGSSWTALNPNSASRRDDTSAPFAASQTVHWLTDIQIDPFNNNVAIFNTGYGLYRTTNLTAAAPIWTFFNEGFEQTAALELASPNTGSVRLLSALGDRGGFRHVDFNVSPAIGAHGQNNGLNVGTDIDIDVAWNDANYVVRAVYSSPYVQYSLNNGVNWSWFSNSNDDLGAGGSLAISADGLYTVYEPTGTHGAGVANQLIYSVRSGSTWGAWTDPATNRPAEGAKVVAELVEPHTFYAIAGTTVSRSTDGGANWEVRATTSSVSNAEWLRAVPGNAGHFLVSRRGSGLWRTTDGGVTWARINSAAVTTANQVGVGKAATLGGYPAIFVGGTVNSQNGFFRSDDQGATWVKISDLSHSYGWSTVIQGDPQVYGRLYVGANGRGVLYADIHSPPATLPSGWSTADIGAVGSAGSAGENAGAWEVIGGGSGIASTSDIFRFAYTTLTGDGSITARVVAVPSASPANNNAKAGVMIRSGLSGNSANAFVALTPGSVNGVIFQSRVTAGASTSSTNATLGIWPPYWVRLTRVGNVFTAYRSPDGVAWTQLGSPTSITMGASVQIGLASTASDNNHLNIAKFDNVTVAAAPTAIVTPVSPDPRATSVSSITITFSSAVSGFDLTDLSLTRDADTINLASATLSSSDGGTTWSLANLASLTPPVGTYTLTLTAAGSGITSGGLPLAAGASDTWQVNVLTGTSGSDAVRVIRNGSATDYVLNNVYQYSFNPAPLTPLLIDLGGGEDSLAIVGATGNDVATFTATSATLGTLSLNHAAVEDLTFDGAGGDDALHLQSGALVLLESTQRLAELTIVTGARLDVRDHHLILTGGEIGTWNGSAYTGITGLIQSGRGDGSWNGSGIVTSMPDATTSVTRTLAPSRANDVGLVGSTLDGITLSAGDVVVRYTWGGDADLNGELNGDDYFYIDSNVVNSGSIFGFSAGDFDLNGEINGDDYFILDSNILFAGGG